MKNIKKFKIHPSTYFIILTFLCTGLIKNILIIGLIILIHELGHVILIKKCGYEILKVEIYPMGGVTTISKKINSSLKKEIIISLAGIIFEIILWLIFYILFKIDLISLNTITLFNKYNMTIILFNLIPIIPLDGYIFLKSLLELFLPFKISFYLSYIISIIAIIIFITINNLYSLNNYLVLSFLIYKMYTTWKNFKFIYNRFLTERYLYDLDYRKIKYENSLKLQVLKKDTFHYFKNKNKVYSEKELLAKRFDKRP